MLDVRSSRLLNRINTLCTGGYKIVEESELLSCFPVSAGVGGEELQRMIAYLEERGYIDVKYADGGQYCLCPLPDGRLYFETAREERTDLKRRRREMLLMTAAGAFFGAFLGALLVLLIARFLPMGGA